MKLRNSQQRLQLRSCEVLQKRAFPRAFAELQEGWHGCWERGRGGGGSWRLAATLAFNDPNFPYLPIPRKQAALLTEGMAGPKPRAPLTSLLPM